MSIMRVAPIAAAILLLNSSSCTRAQRNSRTDDRLQLVAAETGRTDVFPASAFYSGTLVNRSEEQVDVDSVQMPGGYQGAGQFFPCEVQAWSAEKKIWKTPHPISLSEYAGRVTRVSIPAGAKLEVCRNLLPQQAGHSGDSARFALSRTWGNAPTIFSNTFQLGVSEATSESH
jgi:hypothetical protein